MTVEANKAVVRRLFDVIQRGDDDAFQELMAPDFANHALVKNPDRP